MTDSTVSVQTPALPSTSTGRVSALPSALAVALASQDEAAVQSFALAEKSAATRRAYRSDFAVFSAWCAGRDLEPMPANAQTVAAFLADQATTGMHPSTINRRVAAIAYAHELAGAASPTGAKVVRVVLSGIRRAKGTRPTQKAPATAERIKSMLEPIPSTLRGKRDRALLALGFAGAFRRSEALLHGPGRGENTPTPVSISGGVW